MVTYTGLSKAQREQFVWMLQRYVKRAHRKNLLLGTYRKLIKR